MLRTRKESFASTPVPRAKGDQTDNEPLIQNIVHANEGDESLICLKLVIVGSRFQMNVKRKSDIMACKHNDEARLCIVGNPLEAGIAKYFTRFQSFGHENCQHRKKERTMVVPICHRRKKREFWSMAGSSIPFFGCLERNANGPLLSSKCLRTLLHHQKGVSL